ncbi:hypothetical protein GL50803_0032730 [Giardia duodenalis]|uniref:Uncharacterized protein n=1 Tax=Giardia intestinalis (strain ATCC 50803 / WB clone C6) TaxID=184922 RepID=A8BIX7_GIAIC|nr:hypothetical protein GL50803_0032730 [Giardia intestinalis]KAE8304904.1 hypothetical protein GL50803_0032730 [Giardia intestinalis]|eukprot:XP_001706701.1 Hypothetical protein GL50803_32730 [Giardia lamblia ATCC 50803]
MHHRSDCFSNGESSIHFARDDGTVMKYSAEYPFRPLGLLKTETSSGDQQLCDMRTVGDTLFLIYIKKTEQQATTMTIANDVSTKISTITIITPHPASSFTISLDDMLNLRITFINVDSNEDRVLASHRVQIDLREPLLEYNLGFAFSSDSADFHVALPDFYICDVLATKDTLAILSSSFVILYSLVDGSQDPIQLFIPETDVSRVDSGYTTFGGIQHPLLQAYRLFYVGTIILVLTPSCLYQIEHFSDNTVSLTVVSKISNRILAYTATDSLFALCTSSYTVMLLFMPPGADYLSISVYNIANDVNNRLFSLSMDYLVQASQASEASYLEKLPSTWPATPNPLGLAMDRYMDGLVTKRCVRSGTTNILSTFPSRPSHSNIRILLVPLQGKDSVLVTFVHLAPPSSLTSSSSDFTVVGSFIHDLSSESEGARLQRVESLSKAEASAFSGKKDSFFKDLYGGFSPYVKIKTGPDAVAAISEGLFINPSYLKTKPIAYYLHLLVNINVAICIALSKFLVTNSHFNNIKMVKHAKMSILYDILTLRDDMLHHLTSEWNHTVALSTPAEDPQTRLLLSAYGSQDVMGLYSHLYYSPTSDLGLNPPSIHSGNRLLTVFTVGFTSGLSIYDLTKALLLKASPRHYTNAFTTIDTLSLAEYTSSFRHNVFYAEFRLVAWSLSSSYRTTLGGRCSENMPCLSDNFLFDKGPHSKLDKKLNWLPLTSNSAVPHESVYLAGGTLHHTMFLSSCHVPMETSILTPCPDSVVSDINQYVVKLLSANINARNFYLPRFFYTGITTSSDEASKRSVEEGQAQTSAPNGPSVDQKTVNKNAPTQKLYCKFDPIITLREFTRRFLPDFDLLMSILSSLFGILLDVVRTQGSRAKYILRMISLDTVFLELTSLNGFGGMYYFGKDLEASPYRLKLPFYTLGPEASALFPSRGTLPPLLSDSAHISTEYYPSLLLTGLVAQLFFELLQIYTSGMLASNDLLNVEKLANVTEHVNQDATVTYALGPLVLKQNTQSTLYTPAMCDVGTAFDVLFSATARPYQRLLYLNNILLNIHLLAKLDIALVVRTLYQHCSRIAGHQFTIINLLKMYDFFCHAAESIIENPMELQITLKVLQERFGTHMQYYDSIFESNLSINQSDFSEYIAFCKEKIPPFLLHLYDKSPTRDYTIVVESLLYSNEDLMYRQQIVDSYRSDPVYQAKLKEDPSHPIVQLKDAILELRLYRKYRLSCNITKNKILYGMLEACMNATPTTQTVCITYENDPGIDGGGIFRSMISQCFMELLNEEEIRGSPILNMVEHKLIPAFLGYIPLASSEVVPRLSQKRSALYYLGRLFAFAVVYNVRFPKVFDSRLISCLIGGRLYLDNEINNKYKAERENDPMFNVNGTPVDLLYPINSQFYKKYYGSADKLFKFTLGKLYTEGRAKGYITGPPGNMDDLTHLVSALKDIPDYKVPEIFDDMATPDFVVSTRKLTETKNCVLKWVISLFNGIKSGDAFKKHLSEFRNGFRQPFGNAMSQKSDERVQKICQRIDKALSEISLNDFEALFMADLEIDRATIANIIQPYTKSDPLENLGESKPNIRDRKKVLDNLISCLKQVILNPKLMNSTSLGDFMYAATGSRYTIGITLYVKAHNEGPLVIFHTCNNLIELPSSVKSIEEMHRVLLFSMYEAVHGGFGIA